jgi:predicted glycoside hydrolase/deacetylase ChbG (UPF0249 family)
MMERFERKPAILTLHAFGTPVIVQALCAVAAQFDIPTLVAFDKTMSQVRVGNIENEPTMGVAKSWWTIPYSNSPDISTLDAQIALDLKSEILQDKWDVLRHENAVFFSHCGYADGKLFDLSSCHIVRGRELETLCSREFACWLKQNHVELINMTDMLAVLKDTQ